jgi:hypothetical protein
MGRCFKSVALASEEPTPFVAVDQKPDHQIGHAFGFAKAACTAYQLWCINRFNPSDELRAGFGEACVVAAENQRYLIKS